MNKKYNIVILCGANPYKGPGILALDLHKILHADGHLVEIISNQYFVETDITIKTIGKRRTFIDKFRLSNILAKIQNRLNKKENSKYLMLSAYKQNKPIYAKSVLKKIKSKPDVLIYLFSHNFLNPFDLEYIYSRTKVPILFWMMDSAAVTGGCHFTWNCEGYKKKCEKCPGLNPDNSKDVTFLNLVNKQKIFQNINIQPIYATEIQRQMLLESSVFKNIKSHKAFAIVDENNFIKTLSNREKYNLPSDKKLIFFAASHINDKRKGMKLLSNALAILSKKFSDKEKNEIILIIAGNNIDRLDVNWSFNYVSLGYLSQNSFAEVMCCIDLFICPSIEDSGPMVINQSLMCGTPVVAFEMGVAKDFIQNGITGYVAKLGDESDLANGIYSLIKMSPQELIVVSENCRKIALENYSKIETLNQFNKIFEDMLK
jgi:glycosyltransferase involved in cell wall biosynthesis